MIRVNIFYPWKQGAKFDMGYYTGSHIPLVTRKLGSAIKSISIEQGVSGGTPGSPPAFIALAHITFESAEAFQTAFSPHAPEIMADIPNYTAIQPVIQLSEIKLTQ